MTWRLVRRGLVGFPRKPGRLTLEQIKRLRPGLVDALRLHPAIGFGRLGGPQSHPFVLAPAGWPEPAEPIVGAEAVHRQLRRWLAAVGHHEYEQTSEPVAVA